jgi:glutathione S-transferase
MASKGDTTGTTPEITIYALPGSKFVAKVIAALDARNIDHYCTFVAFADVKKRQKELPSGGKLVPEMKVVWEKEKDPVIVSDSEAILHWLDDNLKTKLFPSKEASDLSVRASDKILAGSVWYFNWVDPKGYDASMRRHITEKLFWFVPSFAGGFFVDLLTKSVQAKFRAQAKEALDVTEDELDKRDPILEKLNGELKHFQSFLKSDDQSYFMGPEPSAPDFSVYAQVERLVGDMGDAQLYPPIPEFKKETPELARFWKWHDLMREKHPLKYKGKREPKD